MLGFVNTVTFALLQVTDVFGGETYTLKSDTDFKTSVNPSGVVMLHISAPAELKLTYNGDEHPRRPVYDGYENAIPNVIIL